MIMPTMMQHALVSFMMLFVTVNNYPQKDALIAPKIIIVSDETCRELLVSALKEELSKIDGLDAQVINMCMAYPVDAIQELENTENDVIIDFYKRVRQRFTMLLGALS